MTSFPSAVNSLKSLEIVDQTLFLETISLLPLLADITSYSLGFPPISPLIFFLVFFLGLSSSTHLIMLVISRSPSQLSVLFITIALGILMLSNVLIYTMWTPKWTFSCQNSVLRSGYKIYLIRYLYLNVIRVPQTHHVYQNNYILPKSIIILTLFSQYEVPALTQSLQPETRKLS